MRNERSSLVDAVSQNENRSIQNDMIIAKKKGQVLITYQIRKITKLNYKCFVIELTSSNSAIAEIKSVLLNSVEWEVRASHNSFAVDGTCEDEGDAECLLYRGRSRSLS
jgi:hypothetical protein